MNTSYAPHPGQDAQDLQEIKVAILLHNPLKQLEDTSAEASYTYEEESKQPACLRAGESQIGKGWGGRTG